MGLGACPPLPLPYLGSSPARLAKWGMIDCYGNQRIQLGSQVAGEFKLASIRPVFRKKQLPFLSHTSLQALPSLPSDSGLDGSEIDEEDVVPLEEEDIVKGNTCIPMERTQGKPGFISFHGVPYQTLAGGPAPILDKKPSNYFWFVGPSVLVASFIFPSLYMRRLILMVLDDSLLTDFLILFFTEALFYGGVALFVLMIDLVWRPVSLTAATKSYHPTYQSGLRVSAVAVLVLSLVIPLVTMGIVWPWTGPAASATLAPYLVGLVIQFAFEQYARHRKSTSWPVIPIIFQVYRLHQLNRAAQLVTALSFSVRGAEATSHTLAISNSLGTLLNVLQLLGIICVWSLASFSMRFLPGRTTSNP